MYDVVCELGGKKETTAERGGFELLRHWPQERGGCNIRVCVEGNPDSLENELIAFVDAIEVHCNGFCFDRCAVPAACEQPSRLLPLCFFLGGAVRAAANARRRGESCPARIPGSHTPLPS